MPTLSVGVKSPLAGRWNQFLRDNGWGGGNSDLFDLLSRPINSA